MIFFNNLVFSLNLATPGRSVLVFKAFYAAVIDSV